MKRVGICGNFGLEKNIANGQIVKTKVLTVELKAYFGEDEVVKLDTYGWRKNPVKLFFGCLKLVVLCNNIIIMPAQNGIKVLAPLFVRLCRIFNKKLHYSVIGGWLPEFLQDNQRVLKNIKEINTVYVETRTMRQSLIKLGVKNVVYMPNFKNIKLLTENEMPTNYNEPYRLCTFSRVKKEKGILDAITAVKIFNKKVSKKAFILDIYGTVEAEFNNEFKNAIADSDGNVKYMGIVNFNKSTNVLKDYFALIFPTYYEGEGFPGTVIDAFSAGLPIIATDWRYNSEIISNRKTGFIYKINNDERVIGLIEVLTNIYNKPKLIISMKSKCLKEAKKYDTSIVMKQMIQNIED